MMNLWNENQARRSRRAKFIPRRMASIPLLGAMRSSFERAKENTFLTIFELPFNRRSRLERLKCGGTAKCCAHGRCFFAGTIARSRYDGANKLPVSFRDRASF